MRSARSSDSSIRRGTSVSSATSKPGIEVGLERKLAQQRQAERVDRADRDVAGPVAQLAPARRRNLAAGRRRAQRGDDPLAHLGGRLAREGDREDVRRVDAGTQQVDVAVDQHARLAGARRRLERDVEPRIDGARASLPVARVDARFDRLAPPRTAAKQLSDRQLLIADVVLAAHRRIGAVRSRCAVRAAAAETRLARCRRRRRTAGRAHRRARHPVVGLPALTTGTSDRLPANAT